MDNFHPSSVRLAIYGAFCAAFAAAVWRVAYQLLPIEFELFYGDAAIAVGYILYALSAKAYCLLTTYTVKEDSVSCEQVFLSFERKVIPMKSIDNVRISASLFSRIVGIADVYIDTPGGNRHEMRMRDISMGNAERLVSLVEEYKKK